MGSARNIWIAEQQVFLVECEECSTFTVTRERRTAFRKAWRIGDREVLMHLEAVSQYLRHAGDDGDREVTGTSWMLFAVEGHHADDEPDDAG